MSKTIELPFVNVVSEDLCGLLYTNRDGTRDVFTGKKWVRLKPTQKTEIGIFNKGTIEKWSQFVRDTEESDDRYFSKPQSRYL